MDNSPAFAEHADVLLSDLQLAEVYQRYLRYLQSLPESLRDDYEEALSLFHLDESSPLPKSVADYLESFWKRQAQDHPRAWNDLGCLYYHQRSPLYDLKKALNCFAEGEKAGSADCLLNLGILYRYDHGSEILQDPKQAWSYFARAALFGLADGTLQLAMMLEEGAGFEQDLHTAFSLYHSIYDQLDDWEENPALLVETELGLARLLSENPALSSVLQEKELLRDALHLADDYNLWQSDSGLEARLLQARSRLYSHTAPES